MPDPRTRRGSRRFDPILTGRNDLHILPAALAGGQCTAASAGGQVSARGNAADKAAIGTLDRAARAVRPLNSGSSSCCSGPRMLILHRYLLRQFVQIFVICFCSLDGLYIVIDAFSNLEEFVSYGDKHGGGTMMLMGRYYAYRSLSFFDMTSAIVALMAAMFTLALFQRYNEMTALLAAGIPKWRIVKPVVFAVIAVSLGAAASREMLIPRIRDQLSGDAHDLGGERAKELHPRLDDSTDILIRGQQTVAKDRSIREPNFLLPPTLNSPFKQLQAASAYYQPAAGDRPAGYLFKGMTQPRDLAKRSSLSLNGAPVVLTPKDYSWLKSDECFVASDVTFELLIGSDNWRQYGSLMELVRGLHRQSLGMGADVAVSIHARLLQPICDVTLLFLGLPLILRRGNPNIFLAIGLCVSVVVAFMLGLLGAQYLGASYLISPSLAAWLPVMVFIPLAAGMSTPLRE